MKTVSFKLITLYFILGGDISRLDQTTFQNGSEPPNKNPLAALEDERNEHDQKVLKMRNLNVVSKCTEFEGAPNDPGHGVRVPEEG